MIGNWFLLALEHLWTITGKKRQQEQRAAVVVNKFIQSGQLFINLIKTHWMNYEYEITCIQIEQCFGYFFDFFNKMFDKNANVIGRIKMCWHSLELSNRYQNERTTNTILIAPTTTNILIKSSINAFRYFSTFPFSSDILSRYLWKLKWLFLSLYLSVAIVCACVVQSHERNFPSTCCSILYAA